MNVKDIQPRSAANVTTEVLAAWKAAYPSGVFEISVPSGELDKDGNEINPIRGWMRKPTRNEMRELTSKVKGTDSVTYTEVVLEMLWLGGDEAIKTDDEVFYSAMGVIQDVLDIKEASLKKV